MKKSKNLETRKRHRHSGAPKRFLKNYVKNAIKSKNLLKYEIQDF